MVRGGVYFIFVGGEWFDLDEKMLFEYFEFVGYVIGVFGKWYNGM